MVADAGRSNLLIYANRKRSNSFQMAFGQRQKLSQPQWALFARIREIQKAEVYMGKQKLFFGLEEKWFGLVDHPTNPPLFVCVFVLAMDWEWAESRGFFGV